MSEGAAVAMYRPEANGWAVTWVPNGGTVGIFHDRVEAMKYRDRLDVEMRKHIRS